MGDPIQEYTQRSASQAMAGFFGGTIAVGVVVACYAISANCYFNSRGAAIAVALCVAWVLAAAALMRSSGLFKEDIAQGSPEARLRGMYVLGALAGVFLLTAVMSMVVFVTSDREVSEHVQLIKSISGRGCKPNYQFLDNESGRTLSICGNNLYLENRSQGMATVVEKVGPLGVRILRVDTQP